MKTFPWWSVKWLEAFGLTGARPAETAFRFFTVIAGEIKARGEGDAFVKITWAPAPPDFWERLEAEMGKRAIWKAKLLAREMPETLAAFFRENAAALFPEPGEAKIFCSQDEEGRLCRHAAAALLRFAGDFARNPQLLLEWRGRRTAAAGEEPAGIAFKPRTPAVPALPGPFWAAAGTLAGLADRVLEKVPPREPARPREEALEVLARKAAQKRAALRDDKRRQTAGRDDVR